MAGARGAGRRRAASRPLVTGRISRQSWPKPALSCWAASRRGRWRRPGRRPGPPASKSSAGRWPLRSRWRIRSASKAGALAWSRW